MMTTQEDVYQGFNIYLPKDLQARLDLIMQTIPLFWEKKLYDHFTNHGPVHSERVHRQKLAQLAQELPPTQRLNPDEVFTVSAAAWLYEIGMQSPKLKPVLDFEAQPGEPLSALQLQEIRARRHLLTYQMILDNVSGDRQEPPLSLGLTYPADDYTRAIAEVCLWCNDEPLESVPETLPVRGSDIRLRLLTALLRLADQLYIGSERVDLDLLVNRSRLAQRDFARWWAYHYAQTLPVASGQIRFHYFMPESQRDYLGYIRGLVEPGFSYDKNPTIRYLWEKHQLRLTLQRNPTARFDRQFGFQQLMSRDLMMYLYQAGDRIETESITDDSVIERALLILDYENFVIQLAKEGHFFELDAMSEAIITLLKAATDQFVGMVDAIAIGPWDRPDMMVAAKMLEDNIFQLVTVQDGQSPVDQLNQEIRKRMSEANPPRHITLVAPAKELARFTRDLIGKGQQLVAWISGLPEARIFQTIVGKHEVLTRLLSLPHSGGISNEELEMGEKSCILILGPQFVNGRGQLPYEVAKTRLGRVETEVGNTDFWCTWLFNRKILMTTTEPAFVYINPEHPDVIRVRDMEKTVISAFDAFPNGQEEVAQGPLLQQLLKSQKFMNEQNALRFLSLLKEKGILIRVPASAEMGNQPIWQLDQTTVEVISQKKTVYLTAFILALDHFMVRENRRTVHEHKLNSIVSSFIPERAIATLYEISKSENWVNRADTGEKFHGGNDPIFGVSPNMESIKVAEVLRNQDILLNCLLRVGREENTLDVLFHQLSTIKSFQVEKSALASWLKYLESQRVIILEKGANVLEATRFQLNLEELLVKRLFGRMYVHGLVTTFRIIGANRPENKKPAQSLLDQLTKHVTRHNAQLAEWSMDYAKSIRLVCEDSGGVYLNNHSFVRSLDFRETANCRALVELVKKEGRGGWLPQNIIFKEMEKVVRFGYSRGEHEYWLNTTIHRKKWLEEKKEERGSHQVHQIRPSTQ
jgi:hypothetical protein